MNLIESDSEINGEAPEESQKSVRSKSDQKGIPQSSI
jgi:hypothetical protein